MDTYEKLLNEAVQQNITIDEDSTLLDNEDGYYMETTYGNVILMNQDLQTTAEKKCVLAEELGHYYTSYGDITDQTCMNNRKQELKARRWGYEKLVPLHKLIQAYKIGCRNRFEVAEYIGITEQFLQETITYYIHKHGTYAEAGKYVIYFNPLGVMEKY